MRKLTTCATSFPPVNASPVLRVKELAVEPRVGAQLRIHFSRANLSVDFEDDFRRHPTTAEPHVLIKLRLVRLLSVVPGWSQHADKIKVLLIDPKLQRMKVTRLCSHHVDSSALPRIFVQDRKIKLQTFERLYDLRRRQLVDVKAKDHQRMNKIPRRIGLAILKRKNFSASEEDAVAVLDRSEVDAR